MKTLALDIGGANLKAAHSDGMARSQRFEVWRQPAQLARALANLIGEMPAFEQLAVTMTAELCDCFETKSNGVNAILDSVETSLGKRKRSTTVLVWLSNGSLATLDEARAEPLLAASSNWLALATWSARLSAKGAAIVIDIGSTTSDVIPLHDAVPVPRGRTDLDRLATSELVYAGVRRTPIASLVRSVKVGDRSCRVASEFFATTGDVYIWLGNLAEEPSSTETCDGRPATRAAAATRIARTVCADRSLITDEQIDQIAQQVSESQRNDLLRAISQVEMCLGHRAGSVVISGSGEFLARRTLERLHRPPKIISIAEQFGPDVSSAAPAFALAMLAAERQT